MQGCSAGSDGGEAHDGGGARRDIGPAAAGRLTPGVVRGLARIELFASLSVSEVGVVSHVADFHLFVVVLLPLFPLLGEVVRELLDFFSGFAYLNFGLAHFLEEIVDQLLGAVMLLADLEDLVGLLVAVALGDHVGDLGVGGAAEVEGLSALGSLRHDDLSEFGVFAFFVGRDEGNFAHFDAVW